MIHLYFAAKFVRNFIWTLSIFIIFILLIDFIELLRRYAESIEFIALFFLALLKLPESVYQILPLIIIINSAWVFLSLARNSELIVIRAAGKSSASMYCTSNNIFLIGVLTVGFINPIVASTSKDMQMLRPNSLRDKRQQFQ